MKKIISLIVLILTVASVHAQDPFVAGTSFVQNVIAVNQATTLRVDIGNAPNVPIPVDPDPDENMRIIISPASTFYIPTPATAVAVGGPAAAYFSWSVNPFDFTVTGIQIVPIPGRYSGQITVEIKGIQQSSNIAVATDVLIFVPSGDNGANNSGSATLTVTNPLAVAFTDINASKTNCDVKVAWANSLETNLLKYEIEVSKNGRDYMKVGETAPNNVRQYSSVFTINDQIAASIMYVRVKAVDKDNKAHYSSIVTVNGTCDGSGAWEINAYPVPVKKESFITLNAKTGLFNGKYSLQVVDKSGRQVSNTEVTLSNSKTYKFDLNKSIAAGKYFLKINNKDGSQSTVLPIEIL